MRELGTDHVLLNMTDFIAEKGCNNGVCPLFSSFLAGDNLADTPGPVQVAAAAAPCRYIRTVTSRIAGMPSRPAYRKKVA